MISALLIPLLCMAPPDSSKTTDTIPTTLSEVVVTGNRLQIPFKEINRNIQILDRKTIDALPARSLNELLSYAAGVDIRQRGPFGSQADVSIDGGGFEQSMILVNGVKVTDPQTGHNSLNLPIPTDAIERIEIIRGPAARIYGVNSLTGAINIVTRKPLKSDISANVYAGSGFKDKDTREGDGIYNGRGVQLGGSYVTDKQSHMLYGGYESGNGYRYNTASDNEKIFYQGQIHTSGSDVLTLTGGYVHNKYGANGFYASPIDSQSQEIVQTAIAAAEYRAMLSEKFTLTPRISYRYGYDDYRFYRDNLSKSRSQHHSHALDAELNGTYHTGAGDIGLGLETRNERIKSSNIGDHKRTNYGGYLEFKTTLLKKLDLNAGAYVNYNSDFGWQAFPGLDLGYRMDEHWKLFASAGTGQRIPTFLELYLNQAPANVGNADLGSERAWQAEGGLKYYNSRVLLSASFFYRKTTHFVDWVKAQTTDPWVPDNFDQNRTRGLTFSGNYRFTEQGASWQTLAGLSYTWLSPKFKGGVAEGLLSKYAIESLRDQLIGNLTVQHRGFSLTAASRYNQRISYKSYVLTDGRLAYQWPRYGIYANAQNIFDVTYVEAGAVPMPGRWFTLGLKRAI
ncbi:iron complex outermembrane recepter protein [bacterium A37T11]|nr:iron complex outermembrane recepter protein [bacterium A37T11]